MSNFLVEFIESKLSRVHPQCWVIPICFFSQYINDMKWWIMLLWWSGCRKLYSMNQSQILSCDKYPRQANNWTNMGVYNVQYARSCIFKEKETLMSNIDSHRCRYIRESRLYDWRSWGTCDRRGGIRTIRDRQYWSRVKEFVDWITVNILPMKTFIVRKQGWF